LILLNILGNLRKKIKLPIKIVDALQGLLLEHATVVEPVALQSDLCRDPDDVKILGLAIAGQAACIVTGDQDLLVLKEFKGIPIVTPRSFSNYLE